MSSLIIILCAIIFFVSTAQCTTALAQVPTGLKFGDLPPKIQLAIFGHIQVPPASLLNSLRVCRQWYELLFGKLDIRDTSILLY